MFLIGRLRDAGHNMDSLAWNARQLEMIVGILRYWENGGDRLVVSGMEHFVRIREFSPLEPDWRPGATVHVSKVS